MQYSIQIWRNETHYYLIRFDDTAGNVVGASEPFRFYEDAAYWYDNGGDFTNMPAIADMINSNQDLYTWVVG